MPLDRLRAKERGALNTLAVRVEANRPLIQPRRKFELETKEANAFPWLWSPHLDSWVLSRFQR